MKKNMKVALNDIGGEVVKDNETYLLKDNKTLNNLVLSSTLLNPFKQTTGHNHSGQEEVYFFVSGSGKMLLDDETFEVEEGDVVLIPDGAFHRVIKKPSPFVVIGGDPLSKQPTTPKTDYGKGNFVNPKTVLITRWGYI